MGEIYGSHNVSILAREVDSRRLEIDKGQMPKTRLFLRELDVPGLILAILLLPDRGRRSCIKCRFDFFISGRLGSP